MGAGTHHHCEHDKDQDGEKRGGARYRSVLHKRCLARMTSSQRSWSLVRRSFMGRKSDGDER